MCEVGPGGQGYMRQTTLSFVKSGGPRMSDRARNSTADTRQEEHSKKEELLTKEEDILQTPTVGHTQGGTVGDTRAGFKF